MKKFTILLLVLLVIASCFVFTSCEEDKQSKARQCFDGSYNHDFKIDGTCMWCGKTYCEVYGHTFDGDISPCSRCGEDNPNKEAAEKKAEFEKTMFWAEEAFYVGLFLLIIGLIAHAIVGHASGIFYWLPLLVFLVFVIIEYGNSILNGIIATIYFVLYIFGRLFINSKMYD